MGAEQARREYASRRMPERSAVVLLSPGGRLLAATPAGRDCFAGEAADAGPLSSGTEGIAWSLRPSVRPVT
jgi:hypothetical protein